MDVEVSHKDISNSLRNLKDFVIKNYETVTAKQVRGKMEVDMKLPEGSLKPERKYIEKLLLALIEKHIAAEGPSNRSDEQQEQDSAAANQQVSVTEPKSKPKASKPSSKPIKEQERSKPAKEQKGSKQNDQKASKQRKPSKQVKKPVEGKKEHSRAIQKMQAMCKQATINIPPGVWQKARLGEQELQTAFEELLRKHDLAQNSSAQDVERARCTLATHRDLDGIDTSNIVSRSRRAAAPRINYALAAGNVASSDDSEADEEGSASDADSGLSEPAVDAEEGPGTRDSSPPANGRRTFTLDSDDE
ncbi:hypothetical protein WJX84_011624 [Apatococcus fuscideae]|uniref:Uncharacterized protein n=1 Tax=Apatococcus fuscideae TaxID=2026836 RepID=A0AAW1TAF5_9CHLO